MLVTRLRKRKNEIYAYVGILLNQKKTQWIYADIFNDTNDALDYLMIKGNELKMNLT